MLEIMDYWTKVQHDHPDFKVILGNEIYLVRDGLNKDNFDSIHDKYTHFVLLALDEVGHK